MISLRYLYLDWIVFLLIIRICVNCRKQSISVYILLGCYHLVKNIIGIFVYIICLFFYVHVYKHICISHTIRMYHTHYFSVPFCLLLSNILWPFYPIFSSNIISESILNLSYLLLFGRGEKWHILFFNSS